MASPASPAHPLTPPSEPTTTQHTATQQAPTQTSAVTNSSQPQSRVEALLSEPLTSLTDDGTAKRPRDHRLIHLLLAAHGVSAYQERIPLQLMDFAYRYTSSILSDALHLQHEGYDQADNAPGSRKSRAKQNAEEGDVSLPALRMSIQSRLGNGFGSGPGALPKEFLKGLADEKNRIALGPVVRESDEGIDARVGPLIGGVRLPHERHCLTGVSWGLKDEWESEGEESVGEDGDETMMAEDANGNDMQVDQNGEDERGGEEGMEDEDEEGAGRMEDVFGEDDTGGGGGGGVAEADDDTEMQI